MNCYHLPYYDMILVWKERESPVVVTLENLTIENINSEWMGNLFETSIHYGYLERMNNGKYKVLRFGMDRHGSLQIEKVDEAPLHTILGKLTS